MRVLILLLFLIGCQGQKPEPEPKGQWIGCSEIDGKEYCDVWIVM